MADRYYRSFWQGERRVRADEETDHYHDRDVDEDEDDERHYEDTAAPRKKRVHYSCDECHRRKQKCNRQHPCQHCCARGVPQRCRYSTPAAGAPSSSNSTYDGTSPAHEATTGRHSLSGGAAELSELKHIIERGFDDVLQAVRTSNQSKSLNDSAINHTSDDGEEGDQEDLVILPPKVTVSSSRGSKLLDMLSVDNAVAVLDPTQSLDSSLSIDHALYEMSLRDLRKHGPLSQSLLSCLPPPEEIQRLFDGYMQEWKLLRYPLMIEPMRRCMERLPAMRDRGFISTDEVSSFAVVAAILARAVIRSEPYSAQPSDVHSMYLHARRLVFACMKALCVSDLLGRFDYEKCLALHLSSRFLLLDRRVNEAWVNAGNAVRCAQSIGLHRYDATGRPAREVEECRMLWCALRYDERSFSVMLERPSAINDALCSTTPPTSSPTLSSVDADYIRWRHELATLQGRILTLLQSTASKGIRIRDVLSLDEEVVRFQQRLPMSSLPMPSDTARVLRFLIHSHTLQARIALLRPFFLRTVPRNAQPRVRQRHLACRRGCVEAACEDLTLREDIVREVDDHRNTPHPARNHIRTPRWFTSLVICGAYLLTSQPGGDTQAASASDANQSADMSKDAELQQQARQHLLSFLALANEKQHDGWSRDTTLDREVGIVRMFLEKSCEPGARKNGKRSSISAATTAPKTHSTSAANAYPSSSHNTPASMTSAGSAAETPSRSSSDVRQHEDLQAVFDAWFQSDLNNINMGDIPAVFDMSLLPPPPPLSAPNHASAMQPMMLGDTSSSSPSTSTTTTTMLPPPPMQAATTNGNYMATNEANGVVGGDFWQGFINLLSTQSGQVQ